MIGVIASQAFVPNKFSGLNLWQDDSDIATIIELSGNVSQLGDKSGKGHNAVQLAGVSQPKTGVATIAGHNVLTFDGVSEFLDIPFSVELNPLSFTIFVVCRVTGDTGDFRSPLTSRNTGPSAGYILYAGRDDDWEFWLGTGGAFQGPQNGTRVVILGESVIAKMKGTSGDQILSINDILVDTATSNYNLNTSSPTRIGAGRSEGLGQFFFAGDIGEIILYNLSLAPNKVFELEQYLFSKWGI